jgi:hypothetical protein
MEAWAKELESGKYEQGQYSLKSHDEAYCCLGVLCEMAVSAKVIEPSVSNPAYGNYAYGVERTTGNLPDAVRDWAGLWNRWGCFTKPHRGRYPDLASMSDAGVPFKAIAKVIREAFIEKESDNG